MWGSSACHEYVSVSVGLSVDHPRRTHVVVIGQVWERVDRGDTARSHKCMSESWSKRSLGDGQHGQKNDKDGNNRTRWLRSERQVCALDNVIPTLFSLIFSISKRRKSTINYLIVRGRPAAPAVPSACPAAGSPQSCSIKLYTVEDSYNSVLKAR